MNEATIVPTLAGKLERLSQQFPLPGAWKKPTLFYEAVFIEPVTIHIVGLMSEVEGGELSATGSTGDVHQPALERAYFELLERVCILESMQETQPVLRLRDSLDHVVGEVKRSQVFPHFGPNQTWRSSRSNGVALYTSWDQASVRAHRELIERDRLLRSWYGHFRPVSLQPPRLPLTDLAHLYELLAFSFSAMHDSVAVAGVFGFPRVADAPLVFGFSANERIDAALEAAGRECCQRLGFLWGEEIPVDPPEPQPTAEYHQEVYLCPKNHHRIRAWLRGEHEQWKVDVLPYQPSEPRFVDLTPTQLSGRVRVAKALANSELEVVFGADDPKMPEGLPPEGRIHPIA